MPSLLDGMAAAHCVLVVSRSLRRPSLLSASMRRRASRFITSATTPLPSPARCALRKTIGRAAFVSPVSAARGAHMRTWLLVLVPVDVSRSETVLGTSSREPTRPDLAGLPHQARTDVSAVTVELRLATRQQLST